MAKVGFIYGPVNAPGINPNDQRECASLTVPPLPRAEASTATPPSIIGRSNPSNASIRFTPLPNGQKCGSSAHWEYLLNDARLL
jgi:hypothetical protein